MTTEHITPEQAVELADRSGLLGCELSEFEGKLRAFALAAIAWGRAALTNAEPRQQVPDMFWNHDDAETLYGSIDEFLNDEICNGTPLEVGDVRVIQRAVSMPKVQIRITAVTCIGDALAAHQTADAD